MQNSVLDEVLDDGGQFAVSFLRGRGFEVMLFPGDGVELLDVELFCKALRPAREIEVIQCFRLGENEHYRVPNHRRSLLRYVQDSVRWSLVFSDQQQGMFFRESLGDYYLIAGTPGFMDRFYPVTHEVAEENFAFWMGSLADEAKPFCQALRSKYAPFMHRNAK